MEKEEWKVIKSVGSEFGTTLNSKELSIALKNEVFNPDGRILLHLKTGVPYTVRLVYKCEECEKIHLLACPDLSAEAKKELFGKDIIYLDSSESEYADKKFPYVSIEELTSLFDNFKDAQDIGIECIGGEEEDVKSGMFTCTQVLKCDDKDCTNAHLGCYYDEEIN